MFQVRVMTSGDFDFAVQLANTMDWNMVTEDFEFLKSLEPKGCFVISEGSKPFGIATCLGFGKVGWFGNLIVEEEYRGKGAGSLLVQHAIQYLRRKGIDAIGLYAYPHLKEFYQNQGFQPDEDFSVQHAKTLKAVGIGADLSSGVEQIQQIINFDSGCFGWNRKRLLESIALDQGNLCYCICGDGGVVGYLMATVYESMAWVGPMACQKGRNNAANTLLKAALSKLTQKSVYVVLPKKETALSKTLSEAGFSEEFFVSRMFLGGVKAQDCIYLPESLERG